VRTDETYKMLAQNNGKKRVSERGKKLPRLASGFVLLLAKPEFFWQSV
jgi:hypothetical protein